MKHHACLLVLALVACDKPDATPAPKPASSHTSKGAASSASPTASAGESETKPAAAPPSSGAFTEFAKLINDASDAIEKAARGQKVEGWNIEPGDAADGAKLEGAKRVFSAAEVEALSDKGYVRTNVIVFPDGAVRWMELSYKSEPALVKGNEGLEQASPVLAATTKTFIETLSGDGCAQLPLLSKDEAQKIPPPARDEIKDAKPQLDAVCAGMKGKAEGWKPRYDDLTLGLLAGDKLVAIRSGIEVEGGKLKLLKPRVR